MPELVEMGPAAATGGGAAGGQPPAPDVSFIVGAYNVAPYIEAAVRSALAQRGVTVEVIVVDDASTDDTAEIVGGLADADPRIRLIRLTATSGPSAARNRAIAVARGTWIAQLDGDDTISPERTLRLLELAAASGAEMVADNFERVAEDGTPLGRTMIPRTALPYAFNLGVADFVSGNICFGRAPMSFGAVKPMLRTDIVRASGLRYYDDPALRHEDFLFALEALLAGLRFVVTSEATYQYRQRASSISFRITAAQIAAMQSANATLALRERVAHDPRAAGAMVRYDAALERARRFLTAAEALRRRDPRGAIRASGFSPDLLPLVARFGWEAAMRRMGPLLARRTVAGRAA